MSGETEKEVSGWTVDTLHQFLRAMFQERDLRYQQRFDAQSKALEAALAAQQLAMQTALTAAERAVAAAMAASEKAVEKSERATEKRFDNVNEFRAQLADQAGTFMPRGEAEQRLVSLSEKVDLLRTFASEASGRGAGLTAGWGYLIGAVGLVGAIVALVVR